MRVIPFFTAMAFVLAACGGETVGPQQPPPQPETVETPPAPAGAPIAGRWTGGMAGGIGASSQWTFSADGTYEMTGYPSIGERGRWTSTAGATPSAWTLHFTGRMRCGPCESAGPTEPTDDQDHTIELTANSTAFTLGSWSMSRQ